MASPTDLDIFARSLGGDRRARTELYRKFVHDSSRVKRVGAGYDDLNDFLQDVFNNLLRTGQSWDRHGSLSEWVESVAGWTALAHDRQQAMAGGEKGAIRMCAEVEGEDATRREKLSAYAPPQQGADDSPSVRILSLLGDGDQQVFRKRAMEKATWEETATAAGKPLGAIGPIFARALGRVARLFGAPPPMADDLVPVFSRAWVDPSKPEGRAISLQLDAAFYKLTPEMQKLGLATSYDARMLELWEAAGQSTPPGEALSNHLQQCHYCTSLLRSLILLQEALKSAPGAEFRLCPGSFTLAHFEDASRAAFEEHLAQCSSCRDERTQVQEGQAPAGVREEQAETSKAGAGKMIAWTIAALLVIGVASFFGYRYYSQREVSPLDAQKIDPQTPTVGPSQKYLDLVQNVPLEDAQVMASVKPENRPYVKYAIDRFSLGQTDSALAVSSTLAAQRNDPGVQMVYAMSLYRNHMYTDGYREMLKSEAMQPRDSFRCWIMFQFSLLVGEKKIFQREAEHLSQDPQYRDKVKPILEKALAR